MKENNKLPQHKPQLHKNNKHNTGYDFELLGNNLPELKAYVAPNKYNNLSIDFSNPKAVLALNKAILFTHYNVQYWDIPKNYLCPPIPGRADYIHYMADVLRGSNFGKYPKNITCFDIGTGANCIYPIIGSSEYNWNFIASEIDTTALESAQKIVNNNTALKEKVEIRPQADDKKYFNGVLKQFERVDISICNPPFHSSADDAQKSSVRKVNNLTKTRHKHAPLNFGGTHKELWCDGGELQFIKKMMKESKKYGKSCYWFSSLVSKQNHLDKLTKRLEELQAERFEVIPMGQGNKKSRILIWTFLNKQEQMEWKKQRWQ